MLPSGKFTIIDLENSNFLVETIESSNPYLPGSMLIYWRVRPHLGGIVTPSSYHVFKANPTPCCKKHQAPAGTRLHVTVPHTSELVTRAASLDSAAWDDSLERQGFCFGVTEC